MILSEAKTVRGIYIKFSGDVRTEWFKEERDTSSTANRNRTRRRYYRGHENFLTKKIDFVGDSNGTS